MKKLLFTVCSLMLVLGACKKETDNNNNNNNNNNDPHVYKEQIEGVNLSDENGRSLGKLGEANVHVIDEDLKIYVFPNPCNENVRALIYNLTDDTVQLNCRLMVAQYKDVPGSFPDFMSQSGSIPVENLNDTDSTFIKDIELTVRPNADYSLSLLTSSLSRGFYRLYLETKAGKKYWDNVWIYRP